MKTKLMLIAILTMAGLAPLGCKQNGPVADAVNYKDTMQEAYVYGFPMVMNYGTMYEFFIDKSSSQYKGPFNAVHNEARVFTPKDTAVVTPNSDTPYSMLAMDLRAEPMVLCVPKIDKSRYYSVQLIDMYTFNYGYIGSRATGSDAGCYMVAGPDWKGDAPAGVNKIFHSETQFSLAAYRTQLFNAKDMPNVVKIQARYTIKPLSAFTHRPAPPAAPTIDFPAFTRDDMKLPFPRILNFVLQFCPTPDSEKELRAKFAKVGIEAGKTFDLASLSDSHKAEEALAVKEGYDAIDKRRNTMGTNINGWLVSSPAGNRAFFNGDWTKRAATALAGIYANDSAEATYPFAHNDNNNEALDGSKHNYTITFAAGEFPPVNAFWSITMYDGKTQLLIENPINRYLINSPMLPTLKKNKDGSLTIYIQKAAPSADEKANWLPAPDGPIYLVMRLYWPKETPPSILPAGSGTWKPPVIEAVK
jgi:hypothetical protein